MPKSSSPSKSPAITHAAAILRHLANQRHPPGLTAIARAVSVSPSSCLNFLRVLVDEGFVTFDGEAKTYSLGSAVITLARGALDPDNTLSVSRDFLRKLARDHDATASLWRVTHDHRLIIVGFEMSDTDLRLHMNVGQRVPLLAGAVGRSITALSSIPQVKLARLFGKLRWENAPTFDAYVDELERARLKGWAFDRGNFKRGVTSIAAPICDQDDTPRLGVSVALLGAHHDAAVLEKVGRATVAAARRIRQTLGWSA